MAEILAAHKKISSHFMVYFWTVWKAEALEQDAGHGF